MDDLEIPIKISKWRKLKEFLENRSLTPFDHPEFIIYFLFVIIGFGGFGLWISLYQEFNNDFFNHRNIILSIGSYFVALMATGSIELIFIKEKSIKRILFLSTMSLIALSAVIFLICMGSSTGWGYFLSLLFLAFSLYIWWIANAENTNLTENFFVEQSDKSKELDDSLNAFEDE